jgi:hypothetical protein
MRPTQTTTAQQTYEEYKDKQTKMLHSELGDVIGKLKGCSLSFQDKIQLSRDLTKRLIDEIL